MRNVTLESIGGLENPTHYIVNGHTMTADEFCLFLSAFGYIGKPANVFEVWEAFQDFEEEEFFRGFEDFITWDQTIKDSMSIFLTLEGIMASNPISLN